MKRNGENRPIQDRRNGEEGDEEKLSKKTFYSRPSNEVDIIVSAFCELILGIQTPLFSRTIKSTGVREGSKGLRTDIKGDLSVIISSILLTPTDFYFI